MKKENALKVIAVSFVCPLLYVFLGILARVVYQAVYGVIHAAERQADYDAFVRNVQAAVAANIMYITLAGMVLFLAVIFIVFKVRRKNLSERVLWNPVSFSVYGLVAAATVISIISANLMMLILPENAIEEVAGYTETAASGGILLTIAAAVLMGPIAEEIAFRGFMTTRLKMRFPVWFAVALSTLAFSAGHFTGGIGQLIGTAWTGLLFCLVFLWTKSLRASIFAHILNNAVGFLMPEAVFAEMGLPVKLVLLVVGLAVTAFLLSLIYKRRDKDIKYLKAEGIHQ